jgi:hypothetical protein
MMHEVSFPSAPRPVEDFVRSKVVEEANLENGKHFS